MSRRFSFRAYRRAFRQPLRTARGLWSVREGFVVRCEQGGQVGFGEVAPLPDFGTETVEAAAEFLQQLVETPDLTVSAELPCCAFGVSSAQSPEKCVGHPIVAALLPAGSEAEAVLEQKAITGFRTFKWKIGVEPLAEELVLLERLVAVLPTGGRLRLDANGGLSIEQAQAWLAALMSVQDQIEFLEQPLAVGQEQKMGKLMDATGIPIALDESLNGSRGSEWLSVWQGPLVVKPLLMGSCMPLAERLLPVADRVILSSVFESSVGVHNVGQLAGHLPALNYAIGFDTANAFEDNLSTLEPQTVWNALHHLN